MNKLLNYFGTWRGEDFAESFRIVFDSRSAIKLLESWQNDDSGYDAGAWPRVAARIESTHEGNK